MKRWTAIACAWAALALLVAACGGGGGGGGGSTVAPAPTISIGATTTPLPRATPRVPEVRSGIAQVDTFLDAMQVQPARDRRQAIASLIGYQPLPCSFIPTGDVSAATCRGGETEGTNVPTFAYKSCVWQYLRDDEIGTVLILLGSANIYAVYLPSDQIAPSAEYAVIIYHIVGGDQQQAALITLQGGLIFSYMFSCTSTPEAFVQELGLTDLVYQPAAP